MVTPKTAIDRPAAVCHRAASMVARVSRPCHTNAALVSVAHDPCHAPNRQRIALTSASSRVMAPMAMERRGIEIHPARGHEVDLIVALVMTKANIPAQRKRQHQKIPKKRTALKRQTILKGVLLALALDHAILDAPRVPYPATTPPTPSTSRVHVPASPPPPPLTPTPAVQVPHRPNHHCTLNTTTITHTRKSTRQCRQSTT